MRESINMTPLEIGITLPTILETETLEQIGGIHAAVRHVEQLGFDAVGAPDLIIGDGTPSLDSTVVLAAVSAVTTRVRLWFGVLALPLRAVALVATQIQTLQYVSGNRVVLGIGSGGFSGSPFWRALGVPARERGRSTDAALKVLPQLIAGEPTQLEHVPGQPTVTLAPAVPVPPILIGGSSEVAIHRAATYGDGWVPSLMTPETLASGAAKLRELAQERGRSAPTIAFGSHAELGDDEASRASLARLVRSLVEDHGMSPTDAARIPITGSPGHVAERLSAYAEAGAEHISLALGGGQWMRQCELLAEARALLT
jgi:alkanesulfonate monooxygenase SsuD/methylene tetrahydromethanopterin reductase-like flavin-dependent oxidoreductase (luciferase family)